MFYYRKFGTLKNGSRVLIRFFKDGDQTDVIRFFQSAPREDIRYLSYFSANPQHLDSFLQHLDYSENILLVAVEIDKRSSEIDKGNIVGVAFFSRGSGATDHIGEVHCIFVARPFQKMGLGTMLLDECIKLACNMNIICLTAKIATELKDSIRAFRNKGFETKTLLEKYFHCRNGDLCDVMLMTLPLRPENVEF